jgi:hypothetical protein
MAYFSNIKYRYPVTKNKAPKLDYRYTNNLKYIVKKSHNKSNAAFLYFFSETHTGTGIVLTYSIHLLTVNYIVCVLDL